MTDYSKAQEYRVRDVCRKAGLKAERVILSGACHAIGRGDVVVEEGKALLDHKSTRGKGSITIKRDDLEKIKRYAEENIGILTFSYLSNQTVYAIITLPELLELLKEKWKV